MGVLADYADRPDADGHRSRYGGRQARVRGDDADEKDRYCSDPGGAARLSPHLGRTHLGQVKRGQPSGFLPTRSKRYDLPAGSQ